MHTGEADGIHMDDAREHVGQAVDSEVEAYLVITGKSVRVETVVRTRSDVWYSRWPQNG